MDKLFKKLFEQNIETDQEEAHTLSSSLPYLIAGLGNPGREYRGNRHNVGFMVLDRLAEKLNVTFGRVESKALVTRTSYQGRSILLVKPQTYMNLSGRSVSALLRFYKVPMNQLLVVYDDVDLPLGTLRLRPNGGSSGQKGVKSIIEQLGTENFPRLRIGIDRPPGRMEVTDYVLQDFSKNQAEYLAQILERASDAALTFVTEGLEAAMNKYNGIAE